MPDFKEKFGLDYLRSVQEKKVELPPEMEDAIIAYSRPLLDTLKSSPDQTSKLFDLAKNLKLRVDEIIPVVKYLTGKSYVKTTEVDELGNDTLTLTREG